jgi:uncharacterized protein (DUF305 family)
MTCLLAGCAARPAADGEGAAVATPWRSVNHDDADFALALVAHGRNGVELTRLGRTRAVSPRLRALSTRIGDEAATAADTAQGWVREWGGRFGRLPGYADAGHSHTGTPGHAGPTELARLAATGGPAFDRLLLEALHRHHQGTLTLAGTELATGRNPQARRFASAVRAQSPARVRDLEQLRAALP